MKNQNVLEFSKETLSELLASSDSPLLVDIGAEWCEPCRQMESVVDELADDSAGRALVGKLDADENPQLRLKLGISSIPTCLLYKRREVVQGFIGITPKQDLIAVLDEPLVA